MNYFLWIDDGEAGPYTANDIWQLHELGDLGDGSLIRPEPSKNWRTFDEVRRGLRRELFPESILPAPTPAIVAMGSAIEAKAHLECEKGKSDCSRGIYIILALVFGLLGFHNFYAGHYGRGAAQLLITVLLGWTWIALIAVFLWVVVEIIAESSDGKGRPFN